MYKRRVRSFYKLDKLTEAGPKVRMEVIAMATLTAEAQTIIVSAVT